ncbi:MAG: hypothetical protein J6X58_03275 [Bacteroidales bacterium]|nr:hypothetical protein [Bacteroidales bacterium]
MAWFFFKSGMFYKDRCIKDNIILGFRRLFIPAVVFNVLGFICYLIIEQPKTCFSYEMGFLYVFGTLRGNTPMWFLPSLFVVQVAFSLLRKCHFPTIVITLMAIGLFFLNKDIGFRPYWFYNIPLGLLFYSLGHILKELQYDKKTIVFCVLIYIGLFFINTDINFRDGLFSPTLVSLPWALAGCILLNVLFKSFPCLCVAPLRFFGKHAMEFYCTHIIIISIIEAIFRYTHTIISFVPFLFALFTLYLIVFSLVLHFFKLKHIQWMFGKK